MERTSKELELGTLEVHHRANLGSLVSVIGAATTFGVSNGMLSLAEVSPHTAETLALPLAAAAGLAIKRTVTRHGPISWK